MMSKKIIKPIISSLLCTVFLAGFTGKEKYVELEGAVNGRSSANFAGSSNVRTVLNKGTRGEILAYTKLPSGNYGIKMKVSSGPRTGEIFWVYHRVGNSELALFEDAPNSRSPSRSTSSVEKAKGAETKKDVPATPVPVPRPAPRGDVSDTIDLINNTNSRVNGQGQNCTECSTNTTTGARSTLNGYGVARACSSLMNSQGQLGEHGQSLVSIMAEPKYARYFLGSNALGSFCPKFNTLSTAQKLNAWAWFWTVLAHEEASCNVTQVHGTHIWRNGKLSRLNPYQGYGLWALEKDANVRAWRGAACRSINTAAKQARCAVDILASTSLSKGRTGVSSSSYWGPVRRGADQIRPQMRRFALCF